MKKKRFKKKFQAKKKRTIWDITPLWCFLYSLLLLVGVFGFFLFNPFFKVEEITAVNVPEGVEVKMGDLAEGENIYLLSPEAMRENILEDFLQLNDVTVRKMFPSTLLVKGERRVSVVVWCKEENCYHVDRHGIAYDKAQEEGDLIVQGREKDATNKVMNEEEVAKLSLAAEEMLVEIDHFQLLPEGELEIVTEEGWSAYFSFYDLEDQLANLELLLMEKLGEEERKELRYIELRYGNRIFYQ